MQLSKVILRSFRTFHYDFRRKLNCTEEQFENLQNAWEDETEYSHWRPCVEIPIQHPITCIVGLNETGKSHLIDAIWRACKRKQTKVEDVCRYAEECKFGKVGRPLIGLRWAMLSQGFVSVANSQIGLEDTEQNEASVEDTEESTEPNESGEESEYLSNDTSDTGFGDEATILWDGRSSFTLYAPNTDGIEIGSGGFDRLNKHLPKPFQVRSNVNLPSTVSLKTLIRAALYHSSQEVIQEALPRLAEQDLFANEAELNEHPLNNDEQLVYRLLRSCEEIDVETLVEMAQYSDQMLREFSAQITVRIEEELNLAHWWGQDIDTKLRVELRNDEVSLSITDRTNHWYGLSERSRGMKFFLGYILQIIIELNEHTRPVLFLSDEPDFALSAVGQRDLLRFFRKVVDDPRDDGTCQIVFTTHSFELIDPNFPDRIAILRKGQFDEGTSVVDKAAHRMFEPVRSALGGRGGFLPFIDGPNLIVEGYGDQVFIMRMSQYFARKKANHLDLAALTIVIADGALRVPRIVLAAREIHGDRAYLTVLLDNDEYGNQIASEIKKTDPYLDEHDQVISVFDVMATGENKDSEIEDLIPPGLYLEAMKKYLTEAAPDFSQDKLPSLEELSHAVKTEPMSKVLKEIVVNECPEFKHGYEKGVVIDVVFDLFEGTFDNEDEKKGFLEHLTKLTDALLDRVNENLRHKRHQEIRRTMSRLAKTFVQTNPIESSKTFAMELLDQLRDLGNRVSVAGEFDKAVDKVASDFRLNDGLKTDLIEDYDEFKRIANELPQRLTVNPNLELM